MSLSLSLRPLFRSQTAANGPCARMGWRSGVRHRTPRVRSAGLKSETPRVRSFLSVDDTMVMPSKRRGPKGCGSLGPKIDLRVSPHRGVEGASLGSSDPDPDSKPFLPEAMRSQTTLKHSKSFINLKLTNALEV